MALKLENHPLFGWFCFLIGVLFVGLHILQTDKIILELTSDILEIKFSGGDIAPDAISLSELSKQIRLLERLIKPIIELENPDFEFDKSLIGLSELGNKSISFRYLLKNKKTIFLSAYAFLIQCVSENKTENLPSKTIDELEYISKFNSTYSCNASFGEAFGDNFISYTTFSTEFTSEKIKHVKGSTTVYGKIKWIGGEHPTITLLQTNGEEIDISVKEDDTKVWKPYTNVGIVGQALWKGKDLKISKLTATEIFAFNRLSPTDGFNYLSSVFEDALKSNEHYISPSPNKYS